MWRKKISEIVSKNLREFLALTMKMAKLVSRGAQLIESMESANGVRQFVSTIVEGCKHITAKDGK